MPLYALNLFNLASNDDYREYSRGSAEAVEKHGGRVVAIGGFTEAIHSSGTEPRKVMILVEWASQEGFDAFRRDDSLESLHHLRENGTADYIWWLFEKKPDLRQLLRH